jgi:hypothetical protein
MVGPAAAPAIFDGLLFPFVYEISSLFSYTRSIYPAISHLLHDTLQRGGPGSLSRLNCQIPGRP